MGSTLAEGDFIGYGTIKMITIKMLMERHLRRMEN
jgi:hypothetical protein